MFSVLLSAWREPPACKTRVSQENPSLRIFEECFSHTLTSHSGSSSTATPFNFNKSTWMVFTYESRMFCCRSSGWILPGLTRVWGKTTTMTLFTQECEFQRVNSSSVLDTNMSSLYMGGTDSVPPWECLFPSKHHRCWPAPRACQSTLTNSITSHTFVLFSSLNITDTPQISG